METQQISRNSLTNCGTWANSYMGNDNKLPLTGDGVSFQAGGNINVFGSVGTQWIDDLYTGPATFTYTPVPEPSTWAAASVFGGVALVTVGVRRRKALRSAETAA